MTYTCKRGHTEFHVFTDAKGYSFKRCLACDRDRKRASYARMVGRPVVPNGSRTHCVRGHEFNPENTRVSNGSRHCRVCDRVAMRNWRAARRGVVREMNLLLTEAF